MVDTQSRDAGLGLKIFTAFLLAASALPANEAVADDQASSWVEGFNNKVRLIAGRAPYGSGSALYAGVEIEMPAGWKTYWMAPGDAGGVPPEFDWSQSENLASAAVRFPVPHRLTGKDGQSIGYKDHVIFPVLLAAKNKEKPVDLKLKVSYGACKDICIPAEAELQLPVPPDAADFPALTEAVSTVPAVAAFAANDAAAGPAEHQDPAKDPKLISWRIDGTPEKPKLLFEVADPGGPGGDAFLSGPDGLYLPMTKKLTDEPVKATYEADLSDGVDIKDLKDKTITVTLAGSKGQSAFLIKIPG